MYQPVARLRVGFATNAIWHPQGRAFPTLKGAITARRALAEKFPRCATAIRAPDGSLQMQCDALDPDWRPARQAPIKKRRLKPRNPDYSL